MQGLLPFWLKSISEVRSDVRWLDLSPIHPLGVQLDSGLGFVQVSTSFILRCPHTFAYHLVNVWADIYTYGQKETAGFLVGFQTVRIDPQQGCLWVQYSALHSLPHMMHSDVYLGLVWVWEEVVFVGRRGSLHSPPQWSVAQAEGLLWLMSQCWSVPSCPLPEGEAQSWIGNAGVVGSPHGLPHHWPSQFFQQP